MPHVRTPYNYDPDVASYQSGLDCSDDPSQAQQHMRDECDINIMLSKFGIENLAQVPFQSGDVVFDESFDFQESMNLVVAANNAFLALPARVRASFENDPAQLLDFLNDPANRDEAMRLGLLATPVVTPSPEGSVEPPTPVPEPDQAPKAD